MGKKKGGKSSGAISKGERKSIDPSIVKAVRREKTEVEKLNHKLDAWRKGKKVKLLVPNQGNDAKKHPYIKVLATTIWGDPKKSKYRMYGDSSEKSDDRSVL